MLASGKQIGYLHIVKGSVMVDGKEFAAGDAFAVDPATELNLEATAELEALWFELPADF